MTNTQITAEQYLANRCLLLEKQLEETKGKEDFMDRRYDIACKKIEELEQFIDEISDVCKINICNSEDSYFKGKRYITMIPIWEDETYFEEAMSRFHLWEKCDGES